MRGVIGRAAMSNGERQDFAVTASADASRGGNVVGPPAATVGAYYPSVVALRRRPLTIRVSFNLI